jgi:hypothetical protein
MFSILHRVLLLQCGDYQECIVLEAVPPGPLGQRVSRVQTRELSDYNRFGGCCSLRCAWAIQGGCNGLLGVQDLPELTSWLLQRGYAIQNDATIMLQRQLPDLMCSFEYYPPIEHATQYQVQIQATGETEAADKTNPSKSNHS